jgi:predicted GNAT family N-acyltransferase
MSPAPDPVFREIVHGSTDYRRACELRETLLRRPLGLTFSPEELQAESAQWHFGLFAGDALLACLSAVPADTGEVKLRQIAVRPETQGRGLGRIIMERSESELVRRGCTETWLHARADAVGFYTRLGYQAAGKEFLELGIRHLKMQKTLSAHRG